MKKVVGILLSCVLLLGVCAPMSFAIKQDSADTSSQAGYVIFETDFEHDTVGAKASGFDSDLITDIACMAVADMDGNKVLKSWHGNPTPDDKARMPRMAKEFTLSGMDKLIISYDYISSGGASTFGMGLYTKDGDVNIVNANAPSSYTEWTHIEFVADIKNWTFETFANGEVVKSGEIKKPEGMNVYARISTLLQPEAGWIAIDNFKIMTNDPDYDPVPGILVEDIDAPYNKADAEPETGKVLTIVTEDFEAQEVDKFVKITENGFETSAITAIAPIMVEQEEGNKYARYYHGDPEGNPGVRGQRLGRNITVKGMTKLVVDLDVKSSITGASKLLFSIYDNETKKNVVNITLPHAFKNWTHVKVRLDIVNKQAKIYVGGKLYREEELSALPETMVDMRLSSLMNSDGSWIKVDNVSFVTPDLHLEGEGPVNFKGTGVIWENVKLPEAEKTGMTKVMRMEHPRIMISDWQQIRDKVATDPNCAYWAKNLLADADGIVKTEPTKYVINARDNINDCSTTAKNYMITLAAAYCISGDARYKDRLYAELESVGNWPNWGADAYLCTAHLLLGTAVSYDWLYNDWTEQERESIRGWLLEKGLMEAVLGYEGRIKGTNWVNRVSNWTNVCNGSNMIAALAIADTHPEVTEYILKKGDEGIRHAFVEVSENGAYAETLSYWDYGVRYQVKIMSALDTSLKEGETLPAILDYKNEAGFCNTGDFPMYYNGATGGFNYGDGDTAFSTSPIMFYLAEKYEKPHYTWYTVNQYNTNAKVTLPRHNSAAWALIWYNPEHLATADTGFQLDKFYQGFERDSANGISMRSSWIDDEAMVVMAHAGDATTGHTNHDAGGFVLDWAGERWVHMYGRAPAGLSAGIIYAWPNYHNNTVESGGHFDYYHTRGEANNTIIMNPKQGVSDMYYDYFAPLDRYESGTNTAFGIVNMTPTNKDYVSAKRGIMLTDMRETLVVQDEITAKEPSEFYWFANTLADIIPSGDGKSVILEKNGKQMLVRITQGPADAKFEIVPAQPLPTSPNPSVQPVIEEMKLRIHVQNQQTLNLTVEFTPIENGMAPAAPQPIVPLDSWSTAGSPEEITSQTLGDIVALKVDNPNAYAGGAKTYVDTANLDIMPIVQNGRTLVPVRFISEKFGAKVGWDDATQTVSVTSGMKEITLQIGSNQMLVNGNAITLDVPAQTVGGRTLIPLRALVEALGKQVFWDDRGLIIISNNPVAYTPEKITQIIELLDARIWLDGVEMRGFDSEIYTYDISIPVGGAPKTVTAAASTGASVVQGNPATVTVYGKTYTLNFVEDAYAGSLDPSAVRRIELSANNGAKSVSPSYLPIQSATSSIDWTIDKYPMNGTYDGVINDDVTLNRWSANGANNWVCYDLGSAQTLHSMAIAPYISASRSYTFRIETSVDGANWETVTDAKTTMGKDRDIIKLGDKQARYVRVTGLEATGTTWMGICEVQFYADAQMEAAAQACWSADFYSSKLHGTVGEARQLIITGLNSAGEAVALDLASVKITSKDTAVATVDAQGNVALVGVGATELVVEAEISGMLRKHTIAVQVQ